MIKKTYLILICLVFVLIIGLVINLKFPNNSLTSPKKIDNLFVNSDKEVENTAGISETTKKIEEPQQTTTAEFPPVFQITDVPFQPQAPFANWDKLHDEACEEASLIIVKYFLDKKELTVETMDREILQMVSWEEKNWGVHRDLTAEETADLAKEFYDLNLETKKINSIEDIKKEISQDRLVIVPAAGRLLGNPYYRQPGPIYHMLVVTGYDQNKIITNDVGTKRGQNFSYGENIFFNAIHDWNGTPEKMEQGQKIILILNE